LLEESSINGARGVLVNITGGLDISLHEVNDAVAIIREAAHEDANIIFGAVLDAGLEGEVRVTVIATGFAREEPPRHAATRFPRTKIPATYKLEEVEEYQRQDDEVDEPVAPLMGRSDSRLDVPTFLRRLVR
jgi:cell division protein FtsZ